MSLARNAQIWLPGYLKHAWSAEAARPVSGTRHILFCIADHYEPAHAARDPGVVLARVKEWRERYPVVLDRFRDADDCPPRHTFFYPAEVYRPDVIELLAQLCRQGYGDVDVHLHHHEDTAESLREKLEVFKRQLVEFGLLPVDLSTGRTSYTFVHGNFALADPHPNGRWCGVRDELAVLMETGCVGDFTFPCVPNPAQPRVVNEIYYVRGVRERKRRPYDHGVPAAAGTNAPPGLLMIQGPLCIDWGRRVAGVIPRIDRGDLHPGDPPTIERFRRWVATGVHVAGRPEWTFVKTHTHGATEGFTRMFLGQPMEDFLRAIHAEFNDGARYALHYVTAREMVNIVKAAEDGKSGPPGQYRNYRHQLPGAPG